ncbi:MAG: hypothetical protein ABH822_01225 [Patescibacteria group bacterium]
MPLSPVNILAGIFQDIWGVFLLTWWIIVPIVLVFVCAEFWMTYIIRLHIGNIKWVILRIKTPKEVLKTPKAMEQIFAAMHASYTFGVRPVDKYWRGRVEDWHSFELVGDSQSVYFYIRVAEGFRNLLESSIYSQYPNAEIEVVDDYTQSLPAVLPNNTFDLFGTEFILARDDGYPLRTYPYFEAITEEEKIDTISTITEVMSRLGSGERIWLQLLIRPTGDEWNKKAEEMRDELAGRSKEKKPKLTKGEQNVIGAIENKMSKIGFEGIIRFIYIDEQENFSRNNIAAVMGAFRQFNDMSLNSLKPNLDTMTITTGLFKSIFKKQRVYRRKRLIYENYRRRRFPNKFSIFNTEELATLYHFPSMGVESPMLRPVEFKKGAPPTNLPT